MLEGVEQLQLQCQIELLSPHRGEGDGWQDKSGQVVWEECMLVGACEPPDAAMQLFRLAQQVLQRTVAAAIRRKAGNRHAVVSIHRVVAGKLRAFDQRKDDSVLLPHEGLPDVVQ